MLGLLNCCDLITHIIDVHKIITKVISLTLLCVPKVKISRSLSLARKSELITLLRNTRALL
mgnify:CR=1 FL=1